MKTAERIVMVVIVLVLAGGAVWLYVTLKNEDKELRDAVKRGDYEIPLDKKTTEAEEDWRTYYPRTRANCDWFDYRLRLCRRLYAGVN
jgi:hypothetical protein